MSDETIRGGEDEIIDKVLHDGKAAAGRILDNARRSAESEKRKAETEAGRVRKEIMDQVMRKVATLKSKETAGAHIEAKRILLRSREGAISRVFDTIREELDRLHGDSALYRKGLVNLAVEAVRAIGDTQVTLVLGKDDEALATAEFIAEVAGRLASEGLNAVEIDMVIEPGVAGGGCVARSKDSRIIFDNTFSRRLERVKPSLRSTIVSEVLKSDG
jgi:vacuolar-type H+-ATPase subunit E/Vma4